MENGRQPRQPSLPLRSGPLPVADRRVAQGQVALSSTLALLGLGLLSLAVYLVLVDRYSLLRLWMFPHHTIEAPSISGMRDNLTWMLAFTALFVLYLLAVRITRGLRGRSAWAVVIGVAALCSAALLMIYPATSNDLFDYIIRGRMTALYGLDPFVDVPNRVRFDLFFPYSWWHGVPSAYGPAWELLASWLVRIADSSAVASLVRVPGSIVVANVLVFKAAAVAGYALTVLAIGLTLRTRAPDRALRGVALFAWNPLVLMEAAGNGHNDLVIAALMAFGFYLFSRRNFTLAGLAMVLGALVKFIPALLAPLVVVAAVREIRGRRAQAVYVIATAGAGLLLSAALYSLFWHGGDPFGVQRRSELYFASLPTLVRSLLQPRMGAVTATEIVAGGSVLLLGLWALWCLRGLLLRGGFEGLVGSSLSVLLFYLLVTVLWFSPWYLIWPLTVAAFASEGTAQRATLLFSYTASWKVAVTYLVNVDVHLNPALWGIWPRWLLADWPITLVILAPVWAFLLYEWTRARLSSAPRVSA